MSIKQLRSFLAFQENGSFSAAADELCITKAAVGQQMKLLEESLQTPLFDRNGYRPSLNAVGISFAKEAQKVLDNYDKLFNSLDEDDDYSGTISVGSVPSAILALVPLSVKSMMIEVTNTKIRIVPGMSTDLYDHVLNGSIDVGILSQPQRIEPSLQWVVLVEEPLVLLTSSSFKGTDPIKILQRQPYIRLAQRTSVGLLADQWLTKNKITVKETMIMDSMETLGCMVAHGLGVSVAPDLCKPDPIFSNLRKISLPNSTDARVLGMLTRKDNPKHKIIMKLKQHINNTIKAT
ncbi:LysR family transcriptional regulator [Candidatus Njordibacter sp. Uisw_039]|jgi:DNA-binding transcriptional LysR family regulator|uniref:LysR family transcriptional regulator n=1 Tax=Candidatus Njordibacter sp. Uisw_039 TaxID=3230972 RepID=UPI003D4506C8|tara:strand:- start:353 stop:1228 length:876 start_codon:yes stop_codon:yes gene_type:complete